MRQHTFVPTLVQEAYLCDLRNVIATALQGSSSGRDMFWSAPCDFWYSLGNPDAGFRPHQLETTRNRLGTERTRQPWDSLNESTTKYPQASWVGITA